MPDPNKKLQYIHNKLSRTYSDVPDYETWNKQLTTDDNYKKFIFDWTKENITGAPKEYDIFLTDVGLKKKELPKASSATFTKSIHSEKSPEEIDKIVAGATIKDQENQDPETIKYRFPSNEQLEEITYDPEAYRFSYQKDVQRLNDRKISGEISEEKYNEGLAQLNKQQEDIKALDEYKKEAYEAEIRPGKATILHKDINENNWRGFALKHPLINEEEKERIRHGEMPENVIKNNEFKNYASKEYVEVNPIKTEEDLQLVKETFNLDNKGLNEVKKYSEGLEDKKEFHAQAEKYIRNIPTNTDQYIYKNPDVLKGEIKKEFPNRSEDEIDEYVYKSRERIRKKFANEAISIEYSKYLAQTGDDNEEQAREAFYQAQDVKGLKYLTSNEKQAYELSKELLRLQSLDKRSAADITKINELKSAIKKLTGSDTQIIDDQGNIIDKDAVDKEVYNRYQQQKNTIDKLASIYSQGDIHTLRRARDIASKEIDVARKALTEYEDYAKKHGKWEVGQSIFGGKPELSERLSPEIARTLKTLQEEVKVAENNYLALNKAVMTNADPAGSEKGFYSGMKIFGTTAAEGLLGMFIDDPDIGFTDLEYRQIYPQAAQLHGVPVSVKQKGAASMSTGEFVATAAGYTVPIMLQLAIQKRLALPATSKFSEFADALSKHGKTGKFLANVMKASEEGVQFELAGMGAPTGMAEYATQETLNINKIAQLLPKNKFLNALVKIGAGATSETIAEYSGDVVNEMFTNDKNFIEAMETSIGTTSDERLNKLIATLAMTLPMSGVANVTNNLNTAINDRIEELGGEKYKDYGKVITILNNLKTEEDAIQERSTEEIPLQPTSGYSETLGERDITKEPAGKSEFKERKQAIEEQPISTEVQRTDVGIPTETEEEIKVKPEEVEESEIKPVEEKSIDITIGGETELAGDYKVNIKEGEVSVIDKQGNKVEYSPEDELGKEVESILKDNIDFTAGKRVELSEGITEEEFYKSIAKESNNPEQIIEAWEVEQEKGLEEPSEHQGKLEQRFKDITGLNLDQSIVDLSTKQIETKIVPEKVSAETEQDIIDISQESEEVLQNRYSQARNYIDTKLGEFNKMIDEGVGSFIIPPQLMKVGMKAFAETAKGAITLTEAIDTAWNSIKNKINEKDLNRAKAEFYNRTNNMLKKVSIVETGKEPFRRQKKTEVQREIETGLQSVKNTKGKLDQSYRDLKTKLGIEEKLTTSEKRIISKEQKEKVKEVHGEYKQRKEALDQWITNNVSEIRRLGPTLSSTILRKVNKIKNQKTLDEAIEYLDKKLFSEKTKKAIQERQDIEEKLTDILNNRKYLKKERGYVKAKNLDSDTIDYLGKVSNVIRLTPEQAEKMIGGTEEEIEAKIQDTLDNPNLSFEDKMALVDKLEEAKSLLSFADIQNKTNEELQSDINILKEITDAGREKKRAELEERYLKIINNANTVSEKALGGEQLISDKNEREKINREKKANIIKNLYARVKYYLNRIEGWEGLISEIDKSDDKSILKDMLFEPMKKAEKELMASSQKQYKTLQDKQKEIYKWKTKRDRTQTLVKNNELHDYGTFVKDNGETYWMNHSLDEVAYIYNLLQDPSLDPTFDVMGWTDEMKNKIESIMDDNPKLKEYADWMINEYLPEYYKDVNEVYKKVYGTNLPFHENYMPIRRGIEKYEDLDLLSQGFNKATINNNSLKARIANTEGLKLNNGMEEVITAYIDNMERFKAYAVPLRHISRVLNNPKVKASIEQVSGNETNTLINNFLERFARGGMDPNNRSIMFDTLRRLAIVKQLGMNLPSAIKQIASFPAYSIQADNPIEFAMEYGKILSSLITKEGWTDLIKDFKHIADSAYMKDRYGTGFDRDMAEWSKQAADSKSKLKKGVQKVKRKIIGTDVNFADVFMTPTKVGDKAALYLGGLPLYRIEYNKAKKQGKSEPEARQIALDKFVDATENAQQSKSITQMSDFQSGKPIERFLTTYRTSQFQYLRHTREAARDMNSVLRKPKEERTAEDKKKLTQAIRKMIMYNVTLPTLYTYAAMGVYGLFGDDEEAKAELLDEMLYAGVNQNLSALPLFGDIVSTVVISNMIRGKQWRHNPISLLPSIEDFRKNYQKYHKEAERIEWTDTPMEEFMGMLLPVVDAMGVPASNIKELTYDNIEKLITGEYDSWRDFVGYPNSILPAGRRMEGWGEIQKALDDPNKEEAKKNLLMKDFEDNVGMPIEEYKSKMYELTEKEKAGTLTSDEVAQLFVLRKNSEKAVRSVKTLAKKIGITEYFGKDNAMTNYLMGRHTTYEKSDKLFDKYKTMNKEQWNKYYGELHSIEGLVTKSVSDRVKFLIDVDEAKKTKK